MNKTLIELAVPPSAGLEAVSEWELEELMDVAEGVASDETKQRVLGRIRMNPELASIYGSLCVTLQDVRKLHRDPIYRLSMVISGRLRRDQDLASRWKASLERKRERCAFQTRKTYSAGFYGAAGLALAACAVFFAIGPKFAKPLNEPISRGDGGTTVSRGLSLSEALDKVVENPSLAVSHLKIRLEEEPDNLALRQITIAVLRAAIASPKTNRDDGEAYKKLLEGLEKPTP